VAADHSGSVIVTGLSSGNGGGGDSATGKYVCVPSPVISDLNRTNGTFQMRVDDVLQPGTLVIEAATKLVNWTALATNTLGIGPLHFSEPAPARSGDNPVAFWPRSGK